ncbi:MAG TPA: hypothetical protein VHA09_01590 [Nitrososphaera sp.]|nr:hypothetical protein [Nitrososphaera sp.]
MPDKVVSLHEFKKNAVWRLYDFTVQSNTDRWIGHVQLIIDGVRQLPPSQDYGRHTQVETLIWKYCKQ